MKHIGCYILSMVFAFPVLCANSVNRQERVYADGFNGASYVGSLTMEITYSHKDDQDLEIKGGLPNYYNQTTHVNTCANVAGAITLGYYDGEYDNLIPNFSAKRVILDRVIYTAQNQEVQNVINELYERMGTNTDGEGTTARGFRDGLQDYVEEKGCHISYSAVVANETLNIPAFKQSINDEKLVVLFVSRYNLVSLLGIQGSSTEDSFTMLTYEGNHVLIAYGIREIVYYNDSGNVVEELTLLQVATGYQQEQFAYVVLDSRMQIFEGYQIEIS